MKYTNLYKPITTGMAVLALSGCSMFANKATELEAKIQTPIYSKPLKQRTVLLHVKGDELIKGKGAIGSLAKIFGKDIEVYQKEGRSFLAYKGKGIDGRCAFKEMTVYSDGSIQIVKPRASANVFGKKKEKLDETSKELSDFLFGAMR